MIYGKVENGEVVRYSRQPKSARTSNIWLNQEKLAEEGWLPVEEQKPTLEPWESLGARTETIQVDKIVWTYAVQTTPLTQYKTMKKKQLLTAAKDILESKLDAVEQLPSVYKVLPQARRDAMDADAQAVVTEVNTKRTAINAAVDHAAVDLVYTGIVAFMDPADIDENGFPINNPEI